MSTRILRNTSTGWLIGLIAVLIGGYFIANSALPSHIPGGVIVLGIVMGSLYALTALGLVLIYRTAKIINFAQAEMGAIGASSAIIAVTAFHWNFYIALPVGIIIAMLTGLAADALISWRFSKAPRLILTVVTIGLQQLFGVIAIVMPTPFHHLSPITSFSVPWHQPWHVGPVDFNANDLLVIIAVPLVLIALWWFLEKTPTGTAIRASSDSQDRALLLGIPVRRLSRVVWMLAAGIAGVGAILAAPITFPSLGVIAGPSSLLIPLAAAVVGGMESLPVTFVAAIVLGIFQQAAFWSYPKAPFVDLAMFVVVIVSLLIQPYTPIARRRKTRVTGNELGDYIATREVKPIPPGIAGLPAVRISKAVLIAALLAAAIFIPIAMSESQLVLVANIVIFAIIAVSLVMLTGWSGQVSLGQFAFVGVGSAVTGALLVHAHADMWLALAASALAGAAAALVIGLPALRLPGLFLAVATLAFAVPVSTWLLNSSQFPLLNPNDVPRPVLFGKIPLTSSLAFYELCLAVLVGSIIFVYNLRRSRTGRVSIATRDNANAASSFSISTVKNRTLIFAISGALAGIAGGLYVIALQGVGSAGFPAEESLVVFTMVVLGGLGSITGAVIGAVYVQFVSTYLSSAWQLLATGAGILIVLAIIPEGFGYMFYRLRDAALTLITRGKDVSLVDPAPLAGSAPSSGGGVGSSITGVSGEPPAESAISKTAMRLEALEALDEAQREAAHTQLSAEKTAASGTVNNSASSDHPATAEQKNLSTGATAQEGTAQAVTCMGVDASYGKVKVLSGINMHVDTGEILALLGTNGAGKSTVLRVVSGLLPADSGTVSLYGQDVSDLSPIERVRQGLVTVPGGQGVFPSLTVEENLQMGGWIYRRHGNGQLALDRERVLDLFPALRNRLPVRAGLLSGGEQQMLAIAQSLLCRPKIILIDELSLGLAPAVVGVLLEAIRKLADEGMTIVVVEQSINVATAIAKRAIFLERGRVQFSGSTPSLAEQPDLLRSVFLRAASKSLRRSGEYGESRQDSRKAEIADILLGKAPSDLPMSSSPDLDMQDIEHTTGYPESAAPAMPAMEVRDVYKHYGGISVLDGVNLSVAKGEIVGLIGVNGSGKTTLFDICCGYNIPDSGHVFMDSHDVTGDPAHKRAAKGLGRVFQDARVFPSMTVSEVIAVALERLVEVRDPLLGGLNTVSSSESELAVKIRVEQLIEEFNLGKWRNSFVSELSIGTRRIVELTCIMAHQPDLLLLDEPSSGIAQRESEALGELLVSLRDRSGATFVIIEHDVPLVSSIADRLACLHLGTVITEGHPADVLNNPDVIVAYLGTDEDAIARSSSPLAQSSSSKSSV